MIAPAEAVATTSSMEAQSALAETDYQRQQALSSYLAARADFDRAGATQ